MTGSSRILQGEKISRKLLILGATGSIGRQAIDCVLHANSIAEGSFEVTGLSAAGNIPGLLEAGSRFPGAKLALEKTCDDPRVSYSGDNAGIRLIRETDADLVVNGIAGSAGLLASIESLRAGRDLALANKESVVMAYSHLRKLADAAGRSILPVDSEHAALFQLVNRIGAASITRLSITASGGPFRDFTREQLSGITPDQAAAHPVWKMGRKISIDSATLANKGLELIEAVRLFGIPEERVEVLVHPESLVHALVRTRDSALYAHISSPDMRLPINIALHWPQEVDASWGFLDLAGRTLRFEAPDDERFPMLTLARQAVREGEAATIAYNAANEIAVEAFERGRIGFTGIPGLVASVLEAGWSFTIPDVLSIFEQDARARSIAKAALTEMKC